MTFIKTSKQKSQVKNNKKLKVKEKTFVHTYEQTWQVSGYTMLSVDFGVMFPFHTMKHWLCSFVDKNWFLLLRII